MIPRPRSLILCATLWILPLGATFLTADEPMGLSPVAIPRKETTEDRVAELLDQLQAGGARERATAYACLRDIGPAVLDILPTLHYGKNTETRLRVLDLMDDIRRTHKIPLADKDLEFATVTDPVWRMPAPGQTRAVKLEVTILGRGQASPNMYLFDTIAINLLGPDDRPLTSVWGRNGLNGKNSPLTPALKRGELFVCAIFETKLRRNAAGDELVLDGTEGFGGSFTIKGLKPGRHRILVSVCHDRKNSVDVWSDGTRPWHGSVGCLPVTVHIE